MDKALKLQWDILNNIFELAALRKDDCCENSDDKILSFNVSTDYGLGTAEFKFVYNRKS